MLLKSIRFQISVDQITKQNKVTLSWSEESTMYGLCFEGWWRWTHHFLLVIWLSLLAATPPKALGYLGDTKAVLNGCEDHWTLQDRTVMPLLFQMTVCVDIRVVVPGAWVAFSYSSVHASRPELGLEGDDEALYGWLLRVRHRFPLRLSPIHWHRVCLKRDVPRNSFSLEVDGIMVAERTVIARAIPPSGSLWLGCRPRDQPPGAALGKVELYMFRLWADLGDHGLCEDGTVIGWNAQHWGVTSPKARQRDPYLLCDHRRLRRGARAYRDISNGVNSATKTAFGRLFSPAPVVSATTTSSPAIATPAAHMRSPLVNCNISQLCSNKNAYFWMSISVEAKGRNKTEQDVFRLVSNAFGCHGDSGDAAHGVTGFIDFCQSDRQLQVEQVTCREKSNIRNTICDVLLQLSHAVSACELQRAGVSALQQAGDEQIQARITGEVERVGRDLCGDVEPSSGRFVRCTSISSLDDICRADKLSKLTCSFIEPDSNPAPQPKSESCSSVAPRFCDCTAFCNSASQFFAIRIKINSASVNVKLLQGLLSRHGVAHVCNTMPGPLCQDILKRYQAAHLECHGTQQRLYSCMVILEMSGPVDGCFLNKLLQQLIVSDSGITNERPLTRMVVCGPPSLPVHTLLASNLTWVSSDLLTSDVCQPDPTLLKCEANEKLAVLLTDSCPPTTMQSTTQPSTLTNSNITIAPEALPTSVTNTTQQTYSTAETTAAAQQTNATQGAAPPNTTATLTTINSTQSSTAQPVLTTSQNMTVTVSDTTTVQNTTASDNTTLLTLTENTRLQNTTTAHRNTTEFITLSPVNSTLQITTTDLIDSTFNTTTLSPNHITVPHVTVDTFTPSPNDTTTNNETTVETFTPSPNHTTVNNITTVDTFTPSPNDKTANNVTTVETFTPPPNDTTVSNVTTVDTFTPSPNDTTVSYVTTVDTFTPSPNHTTANNVIVDTFTPPPNDTTVSNVTTVDTFTPSPNHTTVNNAIVYTFTTPPNDTTVSNITTVDTFTPPPVSTFMSSPNPTTVYNVTTATQNYTSGSNNYTTEYNVTTADNNRNLHNGTITSNTTISPSTTSPNHTAGYSVTAANNNRTLQNSSITHNATISTFTPSPDYSVTTAGTFTPSSNHTAVYNATTAIKNYTTTSNNDTAEYNVTTADNNRNLRNDTITTNNATIYTFTASPNQTLMYNVTTATNNYTTAYNVTIANNNRTLHNGSVTRNATTASFTPSPNDNVTTAGRYTPSPNHTVVYNVTTATNNYTTTSNNYTTEYNITTADDSRNLHNTTITTSNETIGTFTTSPNHTIMYNVTTATKNYTTEFNVTTADNNRNLHNGTNTTIDATISTFTASPNHTVMYNVTTATKNYTTASNNYTTVYNVTIANNNKTLHNSSVTSNATVSTFTPSPNYNVTMTSNNYTKEYNITTPDNSMNLHNGTITTSNATMSTFTPSTNYTMVNDVTTVYNNYTTTENITITTVSQNKTTMDNVTTAPIKETQQNTTAPYNNTTMSTAAKQVNETLNNATTPTKNSTVDTITSVVNTTKPTVIPQNNQTGNHTTARVTHNITTISKNDTNFTTAATSVSPIINYSETAGISFNLSSTAGSLTTGFNVTTKGPGVNLTSTATTTTHSTLPVQINTTTAKVFLTSSTTTLQTTTLSSTTTTKPGTGTTATTAVATTLSQEAQEEQANELLDQTQEASQLNSSQVAQLVGKLQKLLDRPTVSQAVGQKAINIISNLMEGDSVALSASANRMVRMVDDLGLKLVVAGDREIVSSNSLVLAVRTVDGTNFPATSVDIFNTDNVQLRAFSRSRSKRSESALGSVFLPSTLTTGLSPEQQQQANRLQFTFYTKSSLFQDASLDNETLVSPVLGSSVANLSISNLSENIQFTIRNINPLHGNYVASCAFWDFTQNSGGGGWSSAGCFVVNATQEDTTCSCNHLTSFAILLDLSREGITDRKQAQILTFITYIGCGISAIFLAVTLLTYLSFEKLLRDIPAKILVQLCMSLLLLNLVFLLDGWLALYPAVGLCISTAFFLHYFLLTSFTWAGLEALHMYLSVIRVFTPYLSRYMLKFSLMGWGIPLVVVIVVIAVDKNNYGLVTYGRYTDGTSDDFCWLRNDIAFYVGVVAYFILIFSLCLLVFIMVMVQLARIKKQNPQNQSPNRGVMTDMRSIAGLIVLLGLTWGFALFAWGPLYLPFVYLFSIFNTLQGFLVFVFHCAVKENVRRQWRTYLCCGRLRLAENSDWSRTATQNHRNMSVATATTTALHTTSRSSSVISDATNSSGSVFVDSGISDGSNSDVVLNELHRNLSL